MTEPTAEDRVREAREAVSRNFSRGPGCGPDCTSCQRADADLNEYRHAIEARYPEAVA